MICPINVFGADELGLAFEDLAAGKTDAEERQGRATAMARMATCGPTVDDWRKNECWDEEFVGYQVLEYYDIFSEADFIDQFDISMQQGGFEPNFRLRGNPRSTGP